MILTLFAFLPFTFVFAQTPVSNGLQVYLPLNETSGTTAADASGNGYAATLVNAPEWTSDGRVGGALKMADRTGRYVSIPSLTWQPTAFSVSWWMYTQSYGTQCNLIYTPAGWGGFVFHSGVQGEVHVGTDLNNRFQLGANMVELNRWQHFAFTFDNGTAKLYKDGKEMASKTGMLNPVAWNGFQIGGNTETNAMHGLLDELRIYNRALTAAEVTTLANWYTIPVCTWKSNATTSTWNEASNWAEGRVPTFNTNAVINACTTCPQLSGNTRVNDLTINASGMLSLQGYTLSVSNNTYLNYATISSNGGTISSYHYSYFYRSIGKDGLLKLEKFGFTANNMQGGNTFYGPVVFTNSPFANIWGTGNVEGDTFYEEVVVNHTSGGSFGFSGGPNDNKRTLFKKNLTVKSTNFSLWGVIIDRVRCEGEVVLNIASGYWGGNIFRSEFIKPVTINLQPYNGSTVYGCPIYIADRAGGDVVFHDQVTVTHTTQLGGGYTPIDIYFGRNGGKCTFLPAASLSIGPAGFRKGNLILENCTFQTTNPISLNLSSSSPEGYSSQVVIGKGTSFAGKLDIKAPNLLLNGGAFYQECSFIKTGAGVNNSLGGNQFKKKVTFTNQAAATSPMNLATQADDLIQF